MTKQDFQYIQIPLCAYPRLIEIDLSVNADEHYMMRQFPKGSDEKRTPVIIAPELHNAWFSTDPVKAAELMTWAHMPELSAESAVKT